MWEHPLGKETTVRDQNNPNLIRTARNPVQQKWEKRTSVQQKWEKRTPVQQKWESKTKSCTTGQHTNKN